MGWGGKREGSGAPKGNLNAYKHGRHSKQYQRLVEIIANDPEARKLASDIARRNKRRHDRDIEVAKALVAALTRLADAAAQTRAEINSGEPDSPDTNPEETK